MHLSVLGQQLRRLRERQEWSLSDVAHRLGISKALLALAEQGRRRLPLDTLRMLVALYNTSIAAVVSTGYPEPRTAPGGYCWKSLDLSNLVARRSVRGCSLLLLRPVCQPEDPEWLELRLEAAAQLPSVGYWSFPVRTDGVATEGHVLIEMPGDELLVRFGESFSIQAGHPHRYRNYLTTPIRALLLLQRAVL